MKPFLLIGSLLLMLNACRSQPSPNTVTMANMTLHHQLETDSLTLTLTAPTSGWIAVGFNHNESLIGSDLIMCRVQNGRGICSDQHIRGIQDHPEDITSGGHHNIRVLDAWENGIQTQIQLRIPLQSGDPLDFIHKPQTDFQLMLAWSVDDDFSHHSRLRKQRSYRWDSQP
jgi:hypothetical protein